MARTAPPPRIPPSGVVSLTPGQIADANNKYQPPLTPEQRAEKQSREKGPDTSHLTVWDPSTRR